MCIRDSNCCTCLLFFALEADFLTTEPFEEDVASILGIKCESFLEADRLDLFPVMLC